MLYNILKEPEKLPTQYKKWHQWAAVTMNALIISGCLYDAAIYQKGSKNLWLNKVIIAIGLLHIINNIIILGRKKLPERIILLLQTISKIGNRLYFAVPGLFIFATIVALSYGAARETFYASTIAIFFSLNAYLNLKLTEIES